jgi:hypothetical protein
LPAKTLAMDANPRAAAARAFVRSLNILLKFARMYDFGHPRTARQYETAWSELRTAIGSDNDAGLLIAVSGDQLLLDGTPLEAAAAEKSFARMLSASGISSIHFSPKVSQASLARFVRGFPTGSGTKPQKLAEQLKAALEGDPHIHVNEVCFVPADSAVAKSTIAAQLTARTLGMGAAQADELFSDPEKLLQLIVAAEGTKGSGSGSSAGEGGTGAGGGSGSGSAGSGSGTGTGPGSGSTGDRGAGAVSGSEDGGGHGTSGYGGGGDSAGGVAGYVGGRGAGGYVAGGVEFAGPAGSTQGQQAEASGYYTSGRGFPVGAASRGEGLVVGGPAGTLSQDHGTDPSSDKPGTEGRPSGGTWNIVNSSGDEGSTALDPETGGFWLGKASSGGRAPVLAGQGPAVAGGPTGAASNGPLTASGSGAAGEWNIIGAAEGSRSRPLDPNAGGFWLGKESAVSGDSGTGRGAGGAALTGGSPVKGGPNGPGTGSGADSDVGPASGWNIIGAPDLDGATSIDASAGGFWLGKDSADKSGTEPGGGAGSLRSDGAVSGESGGSGGSGRLGHGPSGINLGPGAASGYAGGRGAGAAGGIGSGQGAGTGSGSGPGNRGGVVQGSSAAGQSGTGTAGGQGGPKNWQVPSTGSGGGEGGAGIGRWTAATTGIRGSRNARSAAPGSMAVETGLMSLHQDELQGILQVLAQIARTSEGTKDKLDPNAFQSRLSTLPRRARFTVSQALSALAVQAPSESSDRPTLLKLAEHIAIRYALESYERGDIEVNTVRTMLDEMSQELDGLRKILGVYEDKMARAGIEVQSHVDLLAQQFWAQVPEEKKKNVLESQDAWCVPPQKVREYVEELIKRGDTEAAENVLGNYASCMTAKSPEARRQASMGVVELAPLFAKLGERLLVSTIRQAGVQLAEETDSELQSLVGAAFVRLTQEATKMRAFPAVQRAVELVDYVETERPGVGKNLRPRLSVENRLPEFIDDALKTGSIASGLTDLLRRLPGPASEQLAHRFSRSGFREDCELLVSMTKSLGPEGLEHLRKQFRHGQTADALDAVGLLARIDMETLEQALPAKLREWKRTSHDRLVRQIAASGSPERGRLLLSVFDQIDALIRAMAVDEIGLSGKQLSDMKLVRLAEGDLPSDGTGYLQLKAIEALGRLRTSGAEAVLRKIAETKRVFSWANPSELRVVATQAMEKIDPEWAKSFIPRSGLSVAELSIEVLDPDPNSSAIRQRRYPRMRLERPVPATTTNLKENCQMQIPEMTLGGGVAVCETSLHPGTVLGIRMNPTQKPVKAQAIVRDANTQARAFEVVEIELEERAKLRKLLVQLGNLLKQTTPQERSRRGTRTILTSQS